MPVSAPNEAVVTSPAIAMNPATMSRRLRVSIAITSRDMSSKSSMRGHCHTEIAVSLRNGERSVKTSRVPGATQSFNDPRGKNTGGDSVDHKDIASATDGDDRWNRVLSNGIDHQGHLRPDRATLLGHRWEPCSLMTLLDQ